MSAGDIVNFVAASETAGETLETVCMADVAAQPIRWLWPGRFATGKLSLIAGDPGLGKSMLSLMMAAHASRGLPWPDGTDCPAGSALLISGEDDIGDTIRPRLEAAGADLAKIEVVKMVRGSKGRRGFDLERDTAALIAKASEMPDCRLVAIDPISAYLGKTDSHSNAEVRGLLAELAEGVARIGAAAVMISHLNKGTEKGNAIYRASGSLAFVAAARASYIVAKDRNDPERRLFLPTKQNLAPDGEGLAYRVKLGMNGAPYLVFERDPVTMTANEALSAMPAAPKPREKVVEWLRARLAGGRVSARVIWDEARARSFAVATVKRAKEQLGVETVKAEGTLSGGWQWHLPDPSERVTPFSKSDENARRGSTSLPQKSDPLRQEVIPFGESDPLRRGSRGSTFGRRQSDPLWEEAGEASSQPPVDYPDSEVTASCREIDL